MAEMAARFQAVLESKVDLREVQQALNDCQGDIREQLLDFRASVQNDQRSAEGDMRKLLDKKVGLQEFHECLAGKADLRDAVPRAELQDMRLSLERAVSEAQAKVDLKYFEDFED